MKNYDLKHIAFHTLIGLYFIWLCVFCILIYIAANTIIQNGGAGVAKLFLVWVSSNFVMGTALYMVLRLFRNRTLLGKVIMYSYCATAVATLVVVVFMLNRI